MARLVSFLDPVELTNADSFSARREEVGPFALDLLIGPTSVHETTEIKAIPAVNDEIKYRRLGNAFVEAFLKPVPDALALVATPAFGLIAAAVNNSQREIVNIRLRSACVMCHRFAIVEKGHFQLAKSNRWEPLFRVIAAWER